MRRWWYCRACLNAWPSGPHGPAQCAQCKADSSVFELSGVAFEALEGYARFLDYRPCDHDPMEVWNRAAHPMNVPALQVKLFHCRKCRRYQVTMLVGSLVLGSQWVGETELQLNSPS
jgi:hypothetical protein